MQLPQISTPVEIGGGSQASSFSIAMNGKAFRVLSDTLYQNKIGSIVREISCNAYDGHISANKSDVPFIIHLPDAFEPFFSVKDFGVGLSPADINNVFTVYFASTKDQSNDAIGAFGLGAKTPFSYTDQFTVVSTVNGTKRTYSCFITESGVPSTVEMNAEKTKDLNGVEIIMSVKREDYSTFADETRKQLRFFKVKPQILNKPNFSWDVDSRKIEMSNDDFKLYGADTGYSSRRTNANAIQGVVGYEIDHNQLSAKLSNDALKVWDILRYRADLTFKIGDIGVTASREGIEYTAHTISMFEAKLLKIKDTLTIYVNKELSALKTDWDKATYVNGNDVLASFAKATGIGSTKTVNRGGKLAFDITDFLVDNKLTLSAWMPNKLARERQTNSYVIPSKDNIHFVLRDTANRPNMKAKYLLESNSYTCVYEINCESDVTKLDDALIKSLTKQLGGFDKFTKLSDIVLPVHISTGGATARGTYNRPSYYVYKTGTGTNVRQWEKELEPLSDIDELTVYQVVENMSVGDSVSLYAYDRMNKFLVDSPKCIGVRITDVKKIENNPNFMCIADYIQSQRDTFESDSKLKSQYRKLVMTKRLFHTVSISNKIVNSVDELVTFTGERHPIVRIARLVDMGNNTSNLGNLGEFMNWDVGIVADKRAEKVSKIFENLALRYPLLAVYNNWAVHSKIDIAHLAKYLKNM